MNADQYKAALKRVDELLGAKDDTPEAEELSRLADEVEAYEHEHIPIDEWTCGCIDAYGEDPFCKLHGDRRSERPCLRKETHG